MDEIVTQVKNIENHQPNESNTSEAIKKVEQWMDHEIQIIATGNRKIRGVFTCFDKQQNILLNYAYEDVVLPDGLNSIRKELGVVFVPMKHVISCLVLEKKLKQHQQQQQQTKEQQKQPQEEQQD
ncbi:hypothetical protein ACTA71_010870 [Dictyostelium dimigraforme]